MQDAFLLSRAILRFDADLEAAAREDLSTAALAPDGSLWLGGDEGTSIERLTPVEPLVFGKHESYAVGDFLDLFDKDEEIDIEGMDVSEGYLWLIGSHSTKRKKPKDKDLETDLDRLATIKTEMNRYLLGRIPIPNGVPVKQVAGLGDESTVLRAAGLGISEDGNLLIDLLKDDPHLAPFVNAQIPSKENGLDVEGLAARGNRLFIGLRGPVLRGWAVILEMVLEETEPGCLTFADLGKNGRTYYKHFVDLNGLGVRELCLLDNDLLILAGPTMDLEGRLILFRLKKAVKLDGDSVSSQDSKGLELVYDFPFVRGADHAEGLTLSSCLGRRNQLMVVYDTPAPERLPGEHAVFADVFRLDLD